MDQEVLDARAKLAARFGTPAQIGGKGKYEQIQEYMATFNLLTRFNSFILSCYNFDVF
jgi:hypothetical protein